jgi:peptide/nickel transport system substrate-binding protein
MSIKERPMPHSPLARRLPRLSKRSLLGASLLAMLCAALPHQQAHAQGPRNFATLAMVAEPQGLDPMATTADLVGTIMQHVYEPLYTFDANWNVAPMLAETMPTVSGRQDLHHHRCARA